MQKFFAALPPRVSYRRGRRSSKILRTRLREVLATWTFSFLCFEISFLPTSNRYECRGSGVEGNSTRHFLPAITACDLHRRRQIFHHRRRQIFHHRRRSTCSRY